MKNKWIILIGSFTLVMPLIIILVVYLIGNINIFDNPDFWYGYMAYFGTIVLAVVALWQNENANRTNKRIMNQQLRQKIGYFNLVEATGIRRKINKYNDIYVQEEICEETNSVVDECLVVDLQNIGEDIVLNPKVISTKINGNDVKLLTEITAIYINETIGFQFKNPKSNDDVLKINFELEMQNTAGVFYVQSFHLELKRLSTSDPVTFSVRCFNTAISFKEEHANG